MHIQLKDLTEKKDNVKNILVQLELEFEKVKLDYSLIQQENLSLKAFKAKFNELPQNT